MPKRKTVRLNLSFVQPKIKEKFRSNVVFCEAMGRPTQKTWVTEWGRNHNLPSPEEAARMCVLLNAAPEDILLGTGETEAETEKLQADIALVRDLLAQQRTESAKKAPGPETGGMDKLRKEAMDYFRTLTEEQLDQLLRCGRAMFGDKN